MNGDRLFFLLKNEFRLWHRSPQSIRALWPYYQVFLSILIGIFLGVLIGAVLTHLQLPNLHFSEDSPPNNVLWYAGGMVYWILFLYLFGIVFARQQMTREQQTRNWLLSSPLSSRLSFANSVLHPILTGSVGINFLMLLYSVPLLIIYRSPRLAIGMHLTATALTILGVSLSFWGLYISLKWGNHWFWKLLRQALSLSVMGLLIFIFSVLSGVADRFLSLEKVIQIFTEQAKPGHLLGSNSWVWFPVRAVFLDPLSSLTWMITGFGVIGLTIQVLHRPLFNDLQAISTPSTLIAIAPKTQKQFQSYSLHLFVFRDWKLLIDKIRSIGGIFTIFLLLVSYWMCIIFPGISQLDNAVNLAFGSIFISTVNTFILTHYCIAEDPMKDVLRSPPINLAKVKAYKRLAALILVWVSILPIFLFLILGGKPWGLVAVLVFAATTSHAYLRDWNSCSVKQTDVYSMYSNLDELGCRDPKLSRIEGYSFLFWIIIALCFLMHFIPVGMFFLSLEGYILFCAYRRNRLLGDSWSV